MGAAVVAAAAVTASGAVALVVVISTSLQRHRYCSYELITATVNYMKTFFQTARPRAGTCNHESRGESLKFSKNKAAAQPGLATHEHPRKTIQ